jgi:uncharacterized membrane protein
MLAEYYAVKCTGGRTPTIRAQSMKPIWRFLLTVAGAVFGASLASPARVWGALFGGLAALGGAELTALRSELKALNEEVGRLRQDLRQVKESRLVAEPRIDPVIQPKDIAVPVPASVPGTRTVPAAPLPWREVESTRESHPPATEEATSLYSSQADTELPFTGAVRRFLTGGNAVVRVGIVILFFGVAFLLRYMAEHTRVPIEFRLSGIALSGAVLLIVGWRLRAARTGYALALQGGGVGILYLTVFAALRLYATLPASIAFPILAAIAALSAILAVLQSSMSLALLGVTGGFLAPVLASTGEGSHVVLFSYYAILNAGILAMAWFKAWRPLNIAGFLFTFAIGTVWGVLRYQPEAFVSTEPFLVLFWFFFLAIAVLFSLRQPVELTGYIDGTLIFGTPIVVFTLQSMMLHDGLMPLAYTAVTMSAVYLAIAWLLKRWQAESQALLIDAFVAIGVAFLTLAVPLALNAHWNVAAWSLEGAALIWVGCRQRSMLSRVAGTLLSVADGCLSAAQFDMSAGHVSLPLVSYFGVILQSAAAVFSAYTLNRHRQRLQSFEQLIPDGLYCWGLWWWASGGASEIATYWPTQAMALALIFSTFTTLISSAVHRVSQLTAARIGALLQLPVMLVFAVAAMSIQSHPFVDGGWLAWPLAFIGVYSLMYRLEGAAGLPPANLLNAGAAWLFCGLMSWEAAFAIGRAMGGSDAWPMTAWAVIPTAFLYLVPRLVARVPWPFGKNREAYLFLIAVGVALYLCGWSLFTNLTSPGDFAPLPYCPFLNPLDLGQTFALLTVLRYWRFLRAVRSTGFARMDKRLPIPVLAGLTFLWLNAVLLRTLHQWFGVAFGFDAMGASTLVQTSLSIFWALLAFATMLVAARQRRRVAWLVGATLLGVVIAKLFLVDLSRVGSIERIVSFVGVGLLMLVIGYVSPLPPAEEGER